MKPSAKAALLSGLAFPGMGQIHLKRLRRGITIMVCVLAGIGAIVWIATIRALAILAQVQNPSNRVDMKTISNLAMTSSADVSPYYNLILAFIFCCWLFSIVDAYRIGKRMERSENNRVV
jgi:TM2 domain-containing membrane protein YozV